MKNKSILLLPLILIISIFTISVVNSNPPTKNLSLKSAYELALEKATDWNMDAQLYSLTSVDNDDNIIEGLNGRRRYWNFQFGVTNSNNHLIITIHDGKIKNFVPTKGPNLKDELINLDDIKFDSIDILNKAKVQFNLLPGKQWAQGYHFTLNKIDNQVIMEVIGLDDNGYFTRISYDSFTGTLISAIHKIPSGGGVFTTEVEIGLDGDKPVSLEGASLSPNFATDNLFVVWGTVNPYTHDSLPIAKITNNQGLNWKNLKLSDQIIKIWFSDTFDKDDIIYAATYDSILKTTTLGDNWEKIYAIDSHILGIDYFDDYIVLLTDENLIITNNGGEKWETLTVPQYTQYIGIDSNNLIIATEKALFKKSAGGWEKLKDTFKNNIRGLKVFDNNIIYYTDQTISIIDQSNNNFKSINCKEFIEEVFIDIDFKINGYLYVASKDNLLTRVGGDSDETAYLKTNGHQKGNLVNFLIGPSGEKYFIMSPEVIWDEIKKGDF